ncbi:hypothetical protein BpHYR1_006692 [Brachionus plicatilis]|uniref:Uncharacterized protein n=1 Tax=Brachionus plicatilis TaxID=10195 RepID=A0A3M7P6P9_BRAPC|nr:hypothetical protein BpHYR1_006692 [Brachionus plicatilis]
MGLRSINSLKKEISIFFQISKSKLNSFYFTKELNFKYEKIIYFLILKNIFETLHFFNSGSLWN